MNFKGQNRRMFRKPGAAKRALGILASSQELANTVEPMRMANGGLAELRFQRLQQLQEELASLRQKKEPFGGDFAIRRRIEQIENQIQNIVQQAQAQRQPTAPTQGRFSQDVGAGVGAVASKAFQPELLEEAKELLSQIEIEPGDTALEVSGKLVGKLGIPFITAVQIADYLPYVTGKLLAQDLGTPAREAIDYSVDKIRGAGAALQESGFVPAALAAAESVAEDPMGTIERSALGPIQAAAESVAEDPMGTIRRAGATFGEKLFGLPQEAERKAALKGSTLEEKVGAAQAAMLKAAQEQLKKGKEETDTDVDPLQSGIDKLAAESIEGKGRKKNDLLVRIGLNIMAGTDPNALTNIAKGTLAGLDSYRNEELVRDKMAPDIIKTLKSLKSAGLDEAQQNAVLQYLILPREKTTGPERLVREGLAALQAGDYTTAQAKFEAGGVDSADLLIEDYVKRQQQAQAPAASAQEDEGSGFFQNFLR